MEIIISLIGGLGVFIFGMNYMGDGLQRAAGARMKSILEMLTKNRIMGVLVGTLVTALVQSSSATTVMTVGFVNAGLMNLHQAMGIIMGANIGTTTTALLVTLDLDLLTPIMLGLGTFVYITAKKQKIKDVFQVILGFGILFLGMDLMKSAVDPLKQSDVFLEMLSTLDNPLLGILAGFGITAVLQSSSATTGLLIAIAAGSGITLEMAFPIIFGQNIGTCVTAMISSVGANKTAKQASVMHLMFNLIGTLLFLFLLSGPISTLILQYIPGDIEAQIAAAHMSFNIINVIILLPFANLIVKAATVIIKTGSDDSEELVKYIDERLLATPPIALVQAQKETLRLGKMASEQLKLAVEAYNLQSEPKAMEVFKIEKKINELNKAILNYVVKLDKISLTDNEKDKLVILMNVLNDIERVGDHADNIAELTMYLIENKVIFSDSAKEEIIDIFKDTIEVFSLALTSLRDADGALAVEVIEKDKHIDRTFKALRKNHIERLNTYICKPNAGIIFLDTINNLERIGDHSSNIAVSVKDILDKKNN